MLNVNYKQLWSGLLRCSEDSDSNSYCESTIVFTEILHVTWNVILGLCKKVCTFIKVMMNCAGSCWRSKFIALIPPKL